MTVSSLWSVLEKSQCGKSVGTADITRKTLAVDLSIWICEASTSTALRTFHADPVLHLVYRRTVKLLKTGVTPVFVLEGKKRALVSGNDGSGVGTQAQSVVSHAAGTSFEASGKTGERKTGLVRRRTGTEFWRACKSCEELLNLMGVPVLQAAAEGEALCALLNLNGQVDGVITNDSDCFLYGAQVIYTNFSVEALDHNHVVRYEIEKLKALLSDSWDEKVRKEQSTDGTSLEEGDHIPVYRPRSEVNLLAKTTDLCREDMIAFALLTGSDLACGGLRHMGSMKAIRFIQICRERGNRSSVGSAALEALLSWEIEAKTKKIDIDGSNHAMPNGKKQSERHCTNCLHAGDSRRHRSHGCPECGTGPGECCITVTAEEKFYDSVRQKAMSLPRGTFTPSSIVRCYLNPNEGKIPVPRNGESVLKHHRPLARDLLASNLIVNGKTGESSRQYLRQSIPPLLVRFDLMHHTSACRGPKVARGVETRIEQKDVQPVPLKILKEAVHKGHACYEIIWSCTSFLSSLNPEESQKSPGESVDSFTTFEFRRPVESAFPSLLLRYRDDKRREAQSLTETHREQLFLGQPKKQIKSSNVGDGKKSVDQRRAFLGGRMFVRQRRRYRERIFPAQVKRTSTNRSQGTRIARREVDDVASLIRFANNKRSRKKKYPVKIQRDDESDNSSIDSDEGYDSTAF